MHPWGCSVSGYQASSSSASPSSTSTLAIFRLKCLNRINSAVAGENLGTFAANASVPKNCSCPYLLPEFVKHRAFIIQIDLSLHNLFNLGNGDWNSISKEAVLMRKACQLRWFKGSYEKGEKSCRGLSSEILRICKVSANNAISNTCGFVEFAICQEIGNVYWWLMQSSWWILPPSPSESSLSPKLIFVYPVDNLTSPAWVYVGSANYSESAWGKMTKDRVHKGLRHTCRNWECAVVIPVKRAPFCSRPGNANETGEVHDMKIFDGVVQVPMNRKPRSSQNKSSKDSSHPALFQSDDSDGTWKMKRIKGKSSHFRCAFDELLYFGIHFHTREDRRLQTVRFIIGRSYETHLRS